MGQSNDEQLGFADRPQPKGAPEVSPNPQGAPDGGAFPDYAPGPAQTDIGCGSGGQGDARKPFKITGG